MNAKLTELLERWYESRYAPPYEGGIRQITITDVTDLQKRIEAELKQNAKYAAYLIMRGLGDRRGIFDDGIDDETFQEILDEIATTIKDVNCGREKDGV